MHQKLFRQLCEVRNTVHWFAMGEAVRLTGEIDALSVSYPKKQDNEVLLDLAERTCVFLRKVNGPNSRENSEKLLSLLTEIQLGD